MHGQHAKCCRGDRRSRSRQTHISCAQHLFKAGAPPGLPPPAAAAAAAAWAASSRPRRRRSACFASCLRQERMPGANASRGWKRPHCTPMGTGPTARQQQAACWRPAPRLATAEQQLLLAGAARNMCPAPTCWQKRCGSPFHSTVSAIICFSQMWYLCTAVGCGLQGQQERKGRAGGSGTARAVCCGSRAVGVNGHTSASPVPRARLVRVPSPRGPASPGESCACLLGGCHTPGEAGRGQGGQWTSSQAGRRGQGRATYQHALVKWQKAQVVGLCGGPMARKPGAVRCSPRPPCNCCSLCGAPGTPGAALAARACACAPLCQIKARRAPAPPAQRQLQ